MKVFLDDEKISNSVKNVKAYLNDEQVLIENFKNIFSNLSYYYKTNNTSRIEDASLDLAECLKTTHNNQVTDITILMKTIEKYNIIKEKIKLQRKNINSFNE